VRWTLADGARFVSERQGRRWSSLATRRVQVRRGSLEQAWLAAGLPSSSLDGVRAMLGDRVNLDRIQRGFTLDVLTSDGRLAGLEAHVPPRGGGVVRTVSAWLVDGACLADGGLPCSGRMAPLAIAEAHTYGPVGVSASGAVMVQRERAGAVPVSPVRGTVVVADGERGRISIESDDGALLQLDGLRPGVRTDSRVEAGAAVGELDARGVLVTRTLRAAPEGRLLPRPACSTLAPVAHADVRLARLVEGRRALLAWLRGRGADRPRPGVSGRAPM
jgi:hypothetical protein